MWLLRSPASSRNFKRERAGCGIGCISIVIHCSKLSAYQCSQQQWCDCKNLHFYSDVSTFMNTHIPNRVWSLFYGNTCLEKHRRTRQYSLMNQTIWSHPENVGNVHFKLVDFFSYKHNLSKHTLCFTSEINTFLATITAVIESQNIFICIKMSKSK